MAGNRFDECVQKVLNAARSAGAKWEIEDAHEFLLEIFEIAVREQDHTRLDGFASGMAATINELPQLDLRAMSAIDKHKFYGEIKARALKAERTKVFNTMMTGTKAQNTVAAILQRMDVGMYPESYKGRFARDYSAVDALKASMVGDMSGRPLSKHSVQTVREGIDYYARGFINSVLAQPEFREIRRAFQFADVPVLGKHKGYKQTSMDLTDKVYDELINIMDYAKLDSYKPIHPDTPQARKLAEAFRLGMDQSIAMQQRFGMDLSLKQGYAPNALSAHLIADPNIGGKEGGKFIAEAMERIDWERSFPGVPAKSKATKADREALLKEVWEGYSGRHKQQVANGDNGFRASGDLMTRRKNSQQLVFKDGKNWREFHQKFGRNDNILSAVDFQLQQNHRMFSLAEIFGPNPEVGFDTVRRHMIELLESGTVKSPDKAKDIDMLKAADPFHEPEVKSRSVFDEDGNVKKKKITDPETGKTHEVNVKEEELHIGGGRRSVWDRQETLLEDKWLDGFHKFVRTGKEENWLRAAGDSAENMFTDFKRTTGDILFPKDGGLRMMFAEIAGETMHPINPNATKFWSTVRQLKNTAVLGKVLLSSITDSGNVMFSMVQKGADWHEAYNMTLHEMFKKNYGGLDDAGYSRAFVAAFDDLSGSLHGRYSFMEQGGVAKLQEAFFRATGLSTWTDHMRSAAARANSRWLGVHSEKTFGQLPHGLKLALQSHGIQPWQWDIYRKLCSVDINGQTYIVPDRLEINQYRNFGDAVSDQELNEIFEVVKGNWFKDDNKMLPRDVREARTKQLDFFKSNPERFRAQLMLDFQGFLRDEIKHGVIEVDDHTRYFLLRGTRPNTASGEFLRFVSMFKTFPMGVWRRELERGYSFAPGEGLAAGLQPIAQYIALMTGIGYMSVAFSDIASGYTPRVPHNWDSTWSTLQAAVMKGGGMSVYGDLMLSMMDGNTGRLVADVMGPVLGGTIPDGIAFLREALTLGEKTGAKGFRLAMSNMPGGNFMVVRPVMDALILDGLRDFLDPGSIQRIENYNWNNVGRAKIF